MKKYCKAVCLLPKKTLPAEKMPRTAQKSGVFYDELLKLNKNF